MLIMNELLLLCSVMMFYHYMCLFMLFMNDIWNSDNGVLNIVILF